MNYYELPPSAMPDRLEITTIDPCRAACDIGVSSLRTHNFWLCVRYLCLRFKTAALQGQTADMSRQSLTEQGGASFDRDPMQNNITAVSFDFLLLPLLAVGVGRRLFCVSTAWMAAEDPPSASGAKAAI